MSMTFIQRFELTSTQASFVFDNIPTTFTDLLVVVSGRSTFSGGSNSNMTLKFNDSTTGYTARGLQGNGSSTSSSDNIFTDFAYIGSAYNSATTTSNTFNNAQIYIPNYRSSVAKSFSTDAVMENNATYSVQHILGHLWNNNSPITKIEIGDTNGSYVQNSSATLYGITRGSNGGVTVS